MLPERDQNALLDMLNYAREAVDNGKDQHGSQAIAWSAIHGRAQPSRSRIRRKFNDGAHNSFSLVAARTRSGRRHAIIQNRTWLTAS